MLNSGIWETTFKPVCKENIHVYLNVPELLEIFIEEIRKVDRILSKWNKRNLNKKYFNQLRWKKAPTREAIEKQSRWNE